MLVKLSDAAWLVSRHERVVRRRLLLEEGNPAHLRAKKDGAAWLIDTDDLARLWHIDQARLDELQRRERRSPDVMAAQLATLQAQVRDLQKRIGILEALNGSVARSAPNLSEYSSPPIPMGTYAPVSRPTAIVARSSSDGFPSSKRGRARWVEEHGGPKATYVRDWPEMPDWLGPEDAIASVRRHRGWEHWQPVGVEVEE